MLRLVILALFFFLNMAIQHLVAQKLTAEVYSQGPLVKVEIGNKRTKQVVFTNWKGRFEMEVALGDHLVFYREGYSMFEAVVNSEMLGKVYRWNMGKKVVELEEVVVKEGQITEHFNIKEYNTELQTQLQEDIQNNPYLYKPLSSGGGNILGLISVVIDLLRDKEQEKIRAKIDKREREVFKYEDFKLLYPLNFYTNTLSIPEDKVQLFFVFCESKQLRKAQFKRMDSLQKLDKLLSLSKAFLKRTREN